MSNLATVTQQPAQLVRSARPVLLREALDDEKEQRTILAEYIKSQLIEGEDYGTIPGTQKKTLFKAGAEKLCSIFRCTTRFNVEKEIETFADPTVVNAAKPFFYYRFKAEVTSNDTGALVAEGYGSCSSHESKYRYRFRDRTCPVCQQPYIKKSRRDDGYYCFTKLGGCGSNFPPKCVEIESQVLGKEDNPDVADVANTVLKMAKKRALVDAVLSLGRCSDLFTQDIEDGGPLDPIPEPQAAPKFDAERSERIKVETIAAVRACKTIDELKAYVGSYNADPERKPKVSKKATAEIRAEVEKRKAELTPPAKPADQPPSAQPTGAAAAVRAGILNELKRRGAVYADQYGEPFDDWLGREHDGLIFADLENNPQKWSTNQVTLLLGALNEAIEASDGGSD